MERLKSWLLPHSCGGWALTFLLLSLVCVALAYSVRDDIYRTYLGLQPGAQNVGKAAYAASERLNMKQTAGGARVTLESVYAEEEYVVAGFQVEDLTDGRRVGEHPAELQPLIGFEGDEEQHQKDGLGNDIVELTDEGGTDFRMVNNSGQTAEGPDNMGRGPLQNMVAFKPERRLEPGDRHRFRLKIPLTESPVVEMDQRPPPPERFESGTFVFDFEVPVQAVPVVDVGQKATDEGVRLTLDRVINSSGRPLAVVCYEAPGDKHLWFLHGGRGTYMGGWGMSGGMKGVGSSGCQKLLLGGPVKGRSTLEISAIEGMPDCPDKDPKAAEACFNRIGERWIRGSWKFTFNSPEP